MAVASFDSAASSYDKDFTFTKIGQIQRKRVWTYLEKTIRTQDISRVLELNCGTGEDAKYLSDLGCEVLATDVSDRMLTQASKKVDNKNVAFSKLDLSSPKLDTDRKFDLIFSNFGGLNCIDQSALLQLNNWLGDLLNPGAHLIFIIMPSGTLIDKWYNSVKGRQHLTEERRSTKKQEVNVKGQLISTYYHDHEDIIRSFNDFSHIYTKSIGFVPSYLESSRLLKLLLIQDKLMHWYNVDSIKADHYLIHLRKI